MRNDKSPPIDSQYHFVESPYFSLAKIQRDQKNDFQSHPLKVNPSQAFRSSSLDERAVQDDRFLANDYSSSRDALKAPSSATRPVPLHLLEYLKPTLIQERIADDPWKLLVAVTLLNKTSGKLAVPTFWDIMTKWSTPLDLSQANERELISMIRHLGTQNIRARRLIRLSKSYIQEPPSVYDIRRSTRRTDSRRSSRFFTRIDADRYPATPISHLPGTGPYALDSYRIFCSEYDFHGCDEWKRVFPVDKELIRFLRWKWAFVEGVEWSPTKGPLRRVTENFILKLVADLENADEGNSTN